MAFVKFILSADYVGYTTEEVYEVDDTSEEYLNEIGYELARDNANMCCTDDCDIEEFFSFSYEILEGTREEIEEKYGEIL